MGKLFLRYAHVIHTTNHSISVMEVPTSPIRMSSEKGGLEGRGAFIVQCIAVEDTTVSVVQGVDYQGPKGALGELADRAAADLKVEAN